MAIKFRGKIKIAPGVKLNITSKGISSVSLGGKGVTLNSGSKKGATLTTSIPGSGLSHTQKLYGKSSANASESQNTSTGIGMVGLLAIGIVALIVLLAVFG